MDISDEEIVKYLSKEMTRDERQSFEENSRQNEALANRIAEYKKSIRAVRNSGIRNEMDEIHSDMTYSKKRNRYVLSGIAASILILMTIYILFWNKPSPDKLYTIYFEPYPNLELVIRGEEDPVQLALNQYSLGNYPETIHLLSSIEDDFKASFYLAISYMMVDDHTSAIQIFETFPESSIYEQQINWYIGLTYLKQQQFAGAISSFEKIQADEYKYKEAREILDVVRK
ncbi:hypothetical protein [Ekhidna sp.]